MIETDKYAAIRAPRITWSPAALFGAALLVSIGIAQAAQDAHEHGKGELNVVVEGSAIGLELHVPGVDVVGFEHEARTEQEKAAVATALERFSNPEQLFELSVAAKCSVTMAEASLGAEHATHGEHGKDEHGHGDEHEDHNKDEHGHGDKHEDHSKDEHGHGDKHGDHDESEEHSELHAEYRFECADPQLLEQIVVNVFDLLSAKELHAAVVTGQRQTLIELSPVERTIDLAP